MEVDRRRRQHAARAISRLAADELRSRRLETEGVGRPERRAVERARFGRDLDLELGRRRQLPGFRSEADGPRADPTRAAVNRRGDLDGRGGRVGAIERTQRTVEHHADLDSFVDLPLGRREHDAEAPAVRVAALRQIRSQRSTRSRRTFGRVQASHQSNGHQNRESGPPPVQVTKHHVSRGLATSNLRADRRTRTRRGVERSTAWRARHTAADRKPRSGSSELERPSERRSRMARIGQGSRRDSRGKAERATNEVSRVGGTGGDEPPRRIPVWAGGTSNQPRERKGRLLREIDLYRDLCRTWLGAVEGGLARAWRKGAGRKLRSLRAALRLEDL